ncbi:hypothetical protein [Deinococcus yunweiensis]|uniref:hypothetical protein n=1 Tax=Deinococcus yunweiensis TaxID=367282 RepID=UPI00398E5537
MRLRPVLISILLATFSPAQGSPASVATDLAQRLGGLIQTCPEPSPVAVCLRVEGGVVKTAGAIDEAWPDLGSEAWEDGPEQGLQTPIEAGATLLQLLPRGVDGSETLIVLQSQTATQPVAAPPAALSPVLITNPEHAYFVVLDSSNQPVTDLSTIRTGSYTVIASRAGRQTARQTLNVGTDGLRTLSIPQLVVSPAATIRGTIALPQVEGYLFLIMDAKGEVVTDLSALIPGSYDVFSFLNGVPGPLASAILVRAGETVTPTFNAVFETAVTPAPTPAVTTPAPVYTAPPSSPSTGGQCWVNGYTKKNGTHVSGYYRRC